MAGVHNGLEFEDSISKLGLPRAVETHLINQQILTIRQLCGYTEENITAVKYIGEQAKLDIICTLAHFDFRLGDTK